MRHDENHQAESAARRTTATRIGCLVIVCLLAGPVGWIGWQFWKMKAWSNAHRGVLAKIDSLASRRPANITPEHWEEAVGWGRTAFCNLWPWDPDTRGDLRDFSARLDEKMAAGDSLATLQWVWDDLEHRTEAGPRYAAQFRPVRAMTALSEKVRSLRIFT
jgi:hypothetical protein